MGAPQTNQLLDSLSPQSRDRILRVSRHMALPLRTTLQEIGETPEYAYFITSGIASVVVELLEGTIAEVALIGREGVAGALHLLGPALSPTRCFIQLEATGYRIPFAELQALFLESVEIRSRLLEMVQQQTLTVNQLAACNKLHDAEPRLARWLLMVRDRIQSDTILLTQEFLAQMLGTQRTTVVMAAGALQRSGVIHYSRGRIQILDADALAEVACDCFKVVHQLYLALYRI